MAKKRPRRPSLKTEHNGAKNGGGWWGLREEAKRLSKTQRRQRDRIEEEE